MEKRISLPQKKKDASMRRVLREAKHLIEQKGYYNTTVRELCERCMISKTTFFNYFESKERIVLMIIDECAEELQTYIDETLQDCADPVESLRLAFLFLLDSLNRYNNLSGVFFQLASENPSHRDALKQFFQIVTPLVHQAQAVGAIRADIDTDCIVQLLEGLQFSAFYNAPSEERADVFADTFAAWMLFLKGNGACKA
ncbi:MAG: TetR/AcrR family transcriptional regulator [Eubacteriales bacterium]|nr:TetR/AcrR family transcriptional regulator [Eubacteriales bacterium]